MGIKIESEDKVTGTGYYRTSVYEARDLLEHIADGSLPSELAAECPNYGRYDDSETFLVTITVEKL